MRILAIQLSLALFVCVSTAAAAEPAAAFIGPQLPSRLIGSQVPDTGSLTQKTMMTLGALSMMFLLVTGTFKRFAAKRNGGKGGASIEVLCRKPVGQRHALLLVEVEGQRFFIGQGSETFTLISELEGDGMFRQILSESLRDDEAPKLTAKGGA